MAIADSSLAQSEVNRDDLFKAIAAMSPREQAQIAERIALMNAAKQTEVASAVQVAIDGLQASPAPVSPAAEKLAELLKRPEPEVSASTEAAQAQKIAEQIEAKGQNASAAVATGAQLGATAAVVNLATNEVQTNQAQQTKVAGAMHEETVAKAEGREAPAAASTNPFAALLAGFKVPDSMLQYNDSSSVTRIADTGQKRGGEGIQLG